MKRILVWLLLFILVVTITGCGVKENLEKKAGEALTEKLIEKVSDSKVDIDGDKVTIKDDEGQEVTFGTGEWPKSDLAKNIPEFKDGTITNVVDSPDYILITLENVNKDDFAKYLQTIKGDFTEDSIDMNSEEVISYMGGNSKGVGIQISYMSEDGILSIGLTKAE